MISSTVIVGRIAFEPSSNEAKTAATLHINVSQNFKKEGETYPETDKFVCKAFGERAKMILDKYSKGDYAVIHGRMQLSKDYTNSKGETVKGDWELMIDHIDGPFIKKEAKNNNNNNNNRVNTPAPPKPNSAPAPLPTPNRQTPPAPPAPTTSTRPMPPVPPIPPRA